jgi:hypothetical protein
MRLFIRVVVLYEYKLVSSSWPLVTDACTASVPLRSTAYILKAH